MSTLTSAQLHVKRSSTRLHAPPGGVSSLSFGCGGFGTTEPAVDDEHADKQEAALRLRPASGRYVASTPLHSKSFNQQDEHAYDNNSGRSGHDASANGHDGYNYSADRCARPPSTQSSQSSRASWQAQPPLTASKRDQNWEKKRRVWLARRHGSRPPATASSGGGGAGTYARQERYSPMGRVESPMQPPAPPSPLTKFMHQHKVSAPSMQLQSTPPSDMQLQSMSRSDPSEYERVGTAGSQTWYNADYSGGGGPQFTGVGPYPPQYAAQEQQVPAAVVGASFYRAGLSTASSTSSRSTRQPPGGHCSWSPFS